MSFAFTINLNDPNHFSQDNLLVSVMQSALLDWGQYISGGGVIDVELDVANLSNGDLFATHANGGSGGVVTIGSINSRPLYQQGTLSELATGIDPNGSAPDVIITVDTTFLTQGMYLNPDLSHTTVPPGQWDGLSTLVHELGHAWGINSYRDATTGALNPLRESIWDTFIRLQPDGTAFFVGPNAEAVFGGPVPVTTSNGTSNYSHVGNTATDVVDVMSGVGSRNNVRPISQLDLAILKDLGYGTPVPLVTERLKNDTGSNTSDLITNNSTLTGSGDANAVVHFTLDSNSISNTTTADASGTWTFTPPGLTQGQHTIVASESNAAFIGAASLTFALDTIAPVITENLKNNSGSVSAPIGSDPTLTGSGDPSAVIQFTIDGALISATATVNSSGAWTLTPAGLADGQHTAVAMETDAAGNTGTASLTFALLTKISVERFFDSATGDHFYSLSAAEAAQIRTTLPTYHDEGAPWSAPVAGPSTQNVYRFFDVVTHAHFFTDSAAERDNINNTPSLATEYHYEGVAFQDYTSAGPGTLTLERFFNTISHMHTYGASAAENISIRSGGAGPGWIDEGPSFIVHT